jgi:hypothetical protein
VLVCIHRVVRHIPPKHFKMGRDFGLYAPPQTAVVLAFLLTMTRMGTRALEPPPWPDRIQRDFGRDPLRCPRCGQPGMVFYRLTLLCNGQLKPFGGRTWLFKRGLLRGMDASPPPAPLSLPPAAVQHLALGL